MLLVVFLSFFVLNEEKYWSSYELEKERGCVSGDRQGDDNDVKPEEFHLCSRREGTQSLILHGMVCQECSTGPGR